MDPEVPVIIPRRRKEDRPSGRLRKGMYILPSLFTAANIALGYYAILQVTHATAAEPWHFDFAAKAIGFAVLFDGLDGRIARMTNTSSDFGRELDSLADVITFGVAPALLAWMWGFRQLPVFLGSSQLTGKMIQLGSIASFLFLDGGRQPTGSLQHRVAIRSRRIPAVRGRSILWECRFQRGPESLPQ